MFSLWFLSSSLSSWFFIHVQHYFLLLHSTVLSCASFCMFLIILLVSSYICHPPAFFLLESFAKVLLCLRPSHCLTFPNSCILIFIYAHLLDSFFSSYLIRDFLSKIFFSWRYVWRCHFSRLFWFYFQLDAAVVSLCFLSIIVAATGTQGAPLFEL